MKISAIIIGWLANPVIKKYITVTTGLNSILLTRCGLSVDQLPMEAYQSGNYLLEFEYDVKTKSRALSGWYCPLR